MEGWQGKTRGQIEMALLGAARDKMIKSHFIRFCIHAGRARAPPARPPAYTIAWRVPSLSSIGARRPSRFQPVLYVTPGKRRNGLYKKINNAEKKSTRLTPDGADVGHPPHAGERQQPERPTRRAPRCGALRAVLHCGCSEGGRDAGKGEGGS